MYPDRMTTGPVPIKEQSIHEASHMIYGQAEILTLHLRRLLERLDHTGEGKNPDCGATPDMPIVNRIRGAHEMLCKVDEMLGQLERRIFG